MLRIIVVEDNKDLLDLYCTTLSMAGYRVHSAENGCAALDILEKNPVDIMVCDIMMPEMDGFQLVEKMRDAGYKTPVLIISALGDQQTKQRCFETGIDDYMVKPIDVNEMVWRIEAISRRSGLLVASFIKVGETIIDADTLTASWKGAKVALSNKEFLILYKLAGAPGRIFTRRQILEDVWGSEFNHDDHTLDVHIGRLRTKIRNNPDFQIVTVRGLGYRLVEYDG